LSNCFHEGDCIKVCEVPHVLEIVKKGRAADAIMDTGADCTRCGACVDVCPSGALRFDVKGLSKLM
jgi:ferredoxin-type protein NapH